MLVDSHAHLDDPDFDSDREDVLERCRAAGLSYLVAAGGGTGPDNLQAPILLAEGHDWIFATVGVHPHDAKHFEERHADQIRRLARHPKVVAMGEIGLDYHYDNSPREIQKLVLIRQLELAREAELPIVIHCREAWEDLEGIIEAHWKTSGLGGILHCFTGALGDAHKFLDWGFQLSFAGNVTFKNAENIREAVCETPPDRLLIETDCPYLAPVPHRGRRNEPAFVAEIARAVAALRHMSEADLGETVVRNFERLFHLAG